MDNCIHDGIEALCPDDNGIYHAEDPYGKCHQFIFDGTFIPCNLPCEICGDLCWRAENGKHIDKRHWVNCRYMCEKCAIEQYKIPILAETLEHNKIYTH